MKEILKPVGIFLVACAMAFGTVTIEEWLRPVRADSWVTATPEAIALSNHKRERNERVILRDFPEPSTWKIILRERLSKDEVYYLLEDAKGKRVDFKPCGRGNNYIAGEKVKISRKGPYIGADDDFECSLDIYREQ